VIEGDLYQYVVFFNNISVISSDRYQYVVFFNNISVISSDLLKEPLPFRKTNISEGSLQMKQHIDKDHLI
jgi:hypothetical protein